jgi:hypothetical protein
MSVLAARMWCMTAGRVLRRIADPVVVAAPAGVRIRTRIRATPAEAEALAVIGGLLGSVYRSELAGRIRLGRLDRKAHGLWRAERKQAVTAVSSSRWAGAITRAVEDQYRLGMLGLAAQVADLCAAVQVLAQRCALRPGELAPVEDTDTGGRSRRRRGGGYRSAAERFAKTRRLAMLRARLTRTEQALAAGRPSVTAGGKRLWRHRSHLDAADMTEPQWRSKWDAVRMFFTADGESGKPGGNETIGVDEAGRLRIKVPAALAGQLGTHLVIAAPVGFHHRAAEWAARVSVRRAVRYDISYHPGPAPAPELDEVRSGPVLGCDLNADHLACCVLDACGNPVGEPATIAVATAGLAASRRDGRVRAAISTLLDLAHLQNCAAIVVENLDFADARATGRETLGRGARGKRLRRTIAAIPTRQFRSRLSGMAARRQIAIIGVDAAYTSRWGARHWSKPLQQQTSEPVTGHHGAAAAIGRRGLGLAIRRRPAGPRTRQRTSVGTPPARPDHQPSTTPRRCRSPGPPTPPAPGLWVHRTTPTASGQHRSGRTGPTPAQ